MFKEINESKNLHIDPSKVVACGIEEQNGNHVIWFDGINGNTYHSAPFTNKVDAERVLDKYTKGA